MHSFLCAPVFLVLAIISASLLPSISTVAHTPSASNAPGFLFDAANSGTAFVLPLHISIALLGFNDDTASGETSPHLDTQDLYRLLTQSMPVYSPAHVALAREGNVQYHMTYEVQHAPIEMLREYESVMSEAKNYEIIGTTQDGITIMDLDTRKVTPILDRIYARTPTGIDRSDASESQSHLVLIIANPNKMRMNPIRGQPYIYRYRYEGAVDAAPTQQWIASKRYIFADLAAGPLTYGSIEDATDGTVTIGTVPIVAPRTDPTTGAPGKQVSTLFLTQLSTFILSGVRHVFAPDLLFNRIAYAEKTIVPVVVFRNHRKWHPWRQEGGAESLGSGASPSASSKVQGPTNPYKIDLAHLRSSVQRMMLPSQQLLMVHGTHYLHDHKHLSSAIFKALKQDSIVIVTKEKDALDEFSLGTQFHLDSKILLEEFEHASDEIVAGLMMAETNAEEEVEQPASFEAAKAKLNPLAPNTAGVLANGAPTMKASGHRILPVFVLSLIGLPRGVLFDKKHLSVASKRCMLVLQTDHAFSSISAGEEEDAHDNSVAGIKIPFFTDGLIRRIDPRLVTGHIISGLVTALGGLLPPHERFDPVGKAVRANYLWAHGAVPQSGPFASAYSSSPNAATTAAAATTGSNMLSEIFIENIHRNSILSRATSALYEIHQAMQLLQRFEAEYVEEGNAAEDTPHSASPFVGQHDAQALLPGVARATSRRLASQLVDLETQFRSLTTLLERREYDAAHRASGAILLTTRSFHAYAQREIEEVKKELACCHKVYTLDAARTDASSTGIASVMLSAVVLFALAFAVYAILRSRIAPDRQGKSYARNAQLLRPTLSGLANKQRAW